MFDFNWMQHIFLSPQNRSAEENKRRYKLIGTSGQLACHRSNVANIMFCIALRPYGHLCLITRSYLFVMCHERWPGIGGVVKRKRKWRTSIRMEMIVGIGGNHWNSHSWMHSFAHTQSYAHLFSALEVTHSAQMKLMQRQDFVHCSHFLLSLSFAIFFAERKCSNEISIVGVGEAATGAVCHAFAGSRFLPD